MVNTQPKEVGWIRTIEIPIVSLLLSTDGFATPMPSTALVTETAGVKTPSAIVRLEAPLGVSVKFVERTYAVPNRH